LLQLVHLASRRSLNFQEQAFNFADFLIALLVGHSPFDAASVLNANHPFNVNQHHIAREALMYMTYPPSQETIETLRRTLLQVQAGLHPVRDAEALAELEHIILRRIASLRLALESPAPAPPIGQPGAGPVQPSTVTAKPPKDNTA
jgi:hypothetical protein